ncbi:hypothetical protein Tcan_05516 [Toxocara canis]|uniref:Uncharacterized protein n=1 Tax=Toxocara canis TaxID=6265 RepID=A0A0B2VS67_TOXCA|nr:hypothetical protein Tcan_05516 [Toxocara canis]
MFEGDWMQGADGLDEFRCFSLAEGDTRWFIYWIREAQIFGVTDGMTKVFETEMSRAERRKLLGNVADSRLEDDWREAFDCQSFVATELDADHISVGYVLQKQSLDRLKEDVPQRISQLFYFAICALNKTVRKSTDMGVPRSSPIKANKPVPKRENHSLIDPTKRKKSRPTGLHFED